MLRRMNMNELKKRAWRRLKRNPSLWWRPEVIRLTRIEGRLKDMISVISSVSVEREVDYMLSILTEGGWMSLDLSVLRGKVKDVSIRHPPVLKGRRVSRREFEEIAGRKYEAILRLDLSS